MMFLHGIAARIVSRRQSGRKGIVRAALEGAFAEDGCPVCQLLLHQEERWLTVLLVESVNDLSIRRHILTSWGFCHRHAWGMAARTDLGGPLATALIYHSLCSQLLLHCGVIQGPQSSPNSRQAKRPERLDQVLPGRPCPACAARARVEHNYTNSFGRYCAQDTFADRYQSSQGLCLEHLRQVLEVSRPSIREFLLTDQIARLRGAAEPLPPQALAAYWRGPAHPTIRRRLNLLVGPLPFFPHSRSYEQFSDAASLWARPPESNGSDLCSLCTVERRAEQQQLTSLLQRQTTPNALPPLCAEHAWQLVAVARNQHRLDALATWSARLVATAAAKLEAFLGREQATTRGKFLLNWRPAARFPAAVGNWECQVCAHKAAAGQRWLIEVLRAAISGPNAARMPLPCLCLRHAGMALKVASPTLAIALRQQQLERLLQLQQELGEYVRKVHWEYRHEPWGPERDAWQRAVSFFVGDE